MTDLDAMRAERERLDRQIREAEAETVGEFNFALSQLSDALYEHADNGRIPLADSCRKNWVTIILGHAERVTVKFGAWNDYGRGGLTVLAGGMTAEFDPLPSAETMTGLVDFLLAQEDR